MRSDRKYMTLLSSAVFSLGFLIASSANAQQQAAAPGTRYCTKGQSPSH